MIMLHSPPVDTRVAIPCSPSASIQAENSRKVSKSICSNLSRSTNPQSGFSARTIAVDTFNWSLPLIQSQGLPL